MVDAAALNGSQPDQPDEPSLFDCEYTYAEQAQREVYAAMQWGVDPSQVLGEPWCETLLIRPQAGAPDGTGRIPWPISRQGVLCPSLWLDDVRLQLPDEPPGAYFLRLVMTLLAAGYISPTTGDWVDPLYEQLGLDVLDNDEHWERVQRWITGQATDPQLASLVLPGQQVVQQTFGGLSNQLREVWDLYLQCQQMQQEIEQQDAQQDAALWDQAALALRSVDVDALVQQLETQLRQAYMQRHDRQALAQLAGQYGDLYDAIDELMSYATLVEAWARMDDGNVWDLEPQEAIDDITRIQLYMTQCEQERTQELTGLRQALAAVLDDPQQDLLWDSLHTLTLNWVQQLRQRVQQARNILERYPDNPMLV